MSDELIPQILRREPDYDPSTPENFARHDHNLYWVYDGPLRRHPESNRVYRLKEELLLCGGDFDLVAEICDESGRHFYLCEFNDYFHEARVRVRVPCQATPDKMASLLRQHGLEMPNRTPDINRKIARFLDTRPISEHRIVEVTHHWHNGSYVTPRGAIGPNTTGRKMVLADSFTDNQTYCGTLEGWQTTVGRACVNNRLLTFSVSVAFAALVLEPLNAECMGFMLYHKTTVGKGVTVTAACSVAGTKVSDCCSTKNGIETEAAENSDTFLCFDELGNSDNPAEFAKNIYLIGNGRGKGRYREKRRSWRLAWIVTGETSMSECREENGFKPLRGGEVVRLLELPADAGMGWGSFDYLHQCKDSKEFADKLEAVIPQNQGVAAEAFLTRVTADLPRAIAKLNETRAAFIAAEKIWLNLKNAPHELIRALDHFAVVAASGEFAIDVTGWPKGEAIRAASATFRSWYRTQYRKVEHREDRIAQVVPHVAQWVRANASELDKREKKEYTDYDIPVDVFRENTCAGFEYKQVAQRLKSEGILIHSPGGLTLQRRPHGGSPLYDVYCVRLRVGDFGDIGDLG